MIVLFAIDDVDEDDRGNLLFGVGATAHGVRVLVETDTSGQPTVRGLGGLMDPGWPPVTVMEFPPEE